MVDFVRVGITDVPDRVAIRIDLLRIEIHRAQVKAIRDVIAGGVDCIIASISEPIAIGVFLPGVRIIGTDVEVVLEFIPVEIIFVVTRVADAIPVGVRLVFVRDQRSVVEDVREAVSVGVFAANESPGRDAHFADASAADDAEIDRCSGGHRLQVERVDLLGCSGRREEGATLA